MTVLELLTTHRSGKLGDRVHARNPSGAYDRPFVVPNDPKTTRQLQRRARFRLISQQWAGTLTAAQRAGWDAYAAAVTVPSRSGGRRHITGRLMFIRNNMPRPNPVAFTVRDAPVAQSHGVYTLPVINKTIIPDEDRVRFTSADAWTGETGSFLVVQTSDTFPVTVNFFAKPWRFAGVVQGNDTVPPLNPQTVIDGWTPAPIAHKWARVRLARADGRLSEATILPFAPGFF